MKQNNTLLNFSPINDDKPECIAVVSLNRPDAANAFNAAMVDELIDCFAAVEKRKDCRAMILRGMGKHFSAGADLAWMKDSAKLSYKENIKDAERFLIMFEKLYALPIPTIAVIKGSVFGGANGLVACCDIALAEFEARFCLSEVKLGLLPAVILPYLAIKIKTGNLRRLALTGRLFSAEEAQSYGLITLVSKRENLNAVLHNELDAIVSCGPQAQKSVKHLHQHLIQTSYAQGQHTVEAIAKARSGEEGQEGLAAFFSKQKAPWSMYFRKNWNLDEH